MQSAVISNRVFLGIVAFGVSFGLSLVPSWDFTRATVTGVITLLATYAAAFCVDRRRRAYEMLVLNSLHKRIKELEGLKSRIIREVDKIEDQHNLLFTESNKLKNQIAESRSQRDNIHRELKAFAGQKKQLESEIIDLQTEINNLENSKADLNNSCTTLTAEKRRLELNCNASRTEINQLQTQIYDLQEQRQDLENNLTLLGRLKPQIEERLYELRTQLQELEIDFQEQNQLLVATTTQKADIESNLNYLQTKLGEQQTELQQLQSQISLMQDERDLLQNQVWELLQQMETFHQEALVNQPEEDDVNLFPFSAILAPVQILEAQIITENLPEEWLVFMEHLSSYEIQVLKAIVEQENPQPAIKQIAEANITMPNLLIDAINERANDIIGELIINPGGEKLEIYPEYLINVKEMLSIYEDKIIRVSSQISND
ncbi:tellurite resistance TerB C-terminal domain-containing protein [Fortiea contorta]|uniref:tellurite resistance TerB C-terminal domain-containing protein n=1 Tax=Fortiea contorta TaxID=1892405 RepID=UPI0003485898|nr:tellurite resistance TerB C-terminal domain-containing protein [Fortiea contorta]